MPGAGILPIANYDNKLYFLFGKEGPYDDVQGYADFGGGSKEGETPFQNAVREGCEELSGFFGNERQVARWLRKDKIHTIKLVENKERTYTTFIVKADYDVNLPFYFKNHFQFMKKHLNHIVKNVDNGYFEKCEMRWLSFEDIKTHMHLFRGFYKNIVHQICADEDEITRAFFKDCLNHHVVRVKPKSHKSHKSHTHNHHNNHNHHNHHSNKKSHTKGNKTTKRTRKTRKTRKNN